MAGSTSIRPSENSHDWLGHGAYFWESDLERARRWAREHADDPFVVGAVIGLGRCLDLTSGDSSCILKPYYELLAQTNASQGTPMPRNSVKGDGGEWIKRDLDCAVIEFLHQARAADGSTAYETVRGVFFEGGELYPGAGFRERTHIQICVRDLSGILGYFRPPT